MDATHSFFLFNFDAKRNKRIGGAEEKKKNTILAEGGFLLRKKLNFCGIYAGFRQMLMKQQQKRYMFERSELCRFGLNLHLTKPKYQPLAFLPTFSAMRKSRAPVRVKSAGVYFNYFSIFKILSNMCLN